MNIMFLVYHMTLLLYSLLVGFIHIWTQGSAKSTYSIVTWQCDVYKWKYLKKLLELDFLTHKQRKIQEQPLIGVLENSRLTKKSTDVFNCFSIDVEHIFLQHFPVADSAIAVLSKRHNSYY